MKENLIFYILKRTVQKQMNISAKFFCQNKIATVLKKQNIT